MTSDFDQHRSKLRDDYVKSMPRQRLNVALHRLNDTNNDPNLLVTRVSAVEAVARSLLIHHLADGRIEASSLYPKFRFKTPTDLVKEYIEAKCATAPEEVVGAATWELFGEAVHYRNLLVHECTYLGQDKTPALLAACRSVLHKLAEISGLPSDNI